MTESFNVREFAADIGSRSNTYLLQAVALTAALSFNAAVKSSIDAVYPYEKGTVFANWIYAVTIIVILVLIIYILGDTNRNVIKENYASKRNYDRMNRHIVSSGALAFY